MNDERRSRLLGIKLRVLVAEHRGEPTGALDHIEPSPFPSGAAFVLDGAAWVLVEGPADRALGAALAWAVRHDATSLDLVAEQDTGLIARRAAAFTMPIRVWFAEERTLLPAVAEELTMPLVPSPEHVAMTPLIESSGATPNLEHGVVTGEVRGLEVCRVVDEPTVGRLVDDQGAPLVTEQLEVDADGDGGVILEVGVGANDREAFHLLHGHIPKLEALSDVVASVRTHRTDGAAAHPLNRMAPERALRADAMADPSTIGCATLHPLAPPVPRPSMKDLAPCVATGTTPAGTPRTVVFSSGVDLELAPFVADVIAMQRLAADLAGTTPSTADAVMVVLPERDLLPISRRLVELLDHEVELVHPVAAR